MKYLLLSIIVNVVLLLLMVITIHFSKNNYSVIVPVHAIKVAPEFKNKSTVQPKLPPKQQEFFSRKMPSQKNVMGEKKIKTTQTLLMLLHAAISEVQTYPESAIELNQQGSVGVGFTLYPDGHITNVNIIQSSGYPVLDSEALRAMNVAHVSAAHLYIQKPHYFTVDINFVR